MSNFQIVISPSPIRLSLRAKRSNRPVAPSPFRPFLIELPGLVPSDDMFDHCFIFRIVI